MSKYARFHKQARRLCSSCRWDRKKIELCRQMNAWQIIIEANDRKHFLKTEVMIPDKLNSAWTEIELMAAVKALARALGKLPNE